MGRVIRHVLFDLDGTLTDSAEGITRCIAKAAVACGAAPPESARLRGFIGTPLADIFEALLDTADPSRIERAISLYRERFERIGYRENRVYDQIEDLLDALAERGFSLYVATAKQQADADRVIEHFRLHPRFAGVFGVVEDGERRDKALLVRRILTTHGIAPAAAALIGDRSHDVGGARRAGVCAIGAAWGYGSVEELREAKADHVAAAPRDVLGCLERPV